VVALASAWFCPLFMDVLPFPSATRRPSLRVDQKKERNGRSCELYTPPTCSTTPGCAVCGCLSLLWRLYCSILVLESIDRSSLISFTVVCRAACFFSIKKPITVRLIHQCDEMIDVSSCYGSQTAAFVLVTKASLRRLNSKNTSASYQLRPS